MLYVLFIYILISLRYFIILRFFYPLVTKVFKKENFHFVNILNILMITYIREVKDCDYYSFAEHGLDIQGSMKQ